MARAKAKTARKRPRRRSSLALGLSLLSSGVVFVLFTEWIFFITKPSFFQAFALGERVHAPLIAVGLIITLLLPVFAALAFWKSPEWSGRVMLTGLCFVGLVLMVDNFTHRILSFAIKDLGVVGRMIYLVALGALGTRVYRWTAGLRPGPWEIPGAALGTAGLLCFALVLLRSSSRVPLAGPAQRKLPNILLIAADGVPASHFSFYGYERETAPNLARLAKRSLIVENVSTNAPHTYAAVLSMLTGREPASSRVFTYPSVLQGEDSYRHLPGLLKDLGYDSYQSSMRHYADSADANLLGGFDFANGRVLPDSFLYFRMANGSPASGLFIDGVLSRVQQRAEHLTGLRRAPDEFADVTKVQNPKLFFSDADRSAETLRFLKTTDGPFFVHLHFLATHCCSYYPPKRVFSTRSLAADAWEVFDDALLETDRRAGEVLDWLEASGKMKDTIVIFSSDHGDHWSTVPNVPLFVYAPGDRLAGQRRHVAQLLDVAPTVLDLIGEPKPAWMEGQSLLKEDLVSERPIFIASEPEAISKKVNVGLDEGVFVHKVAKERYGLKTYQMKVCQNWYEYDLVRKTVRIETVPGFTRPCPREKLPDYRQAGDQLRRYLEQKGVAD